MKPREILVRTAIVLGMPCEICGAKATVPDHCHRTRIYRGPLCNSCNTAIGLFEENISRIKSAISYLDKYNFLTEEG
jgi:hypothetical protein